MSSPASSDISQDDAKMLEEQHCEMQQRHDQEEQSLLQLQKAAEAYYVECVAQKARRKVEAKAKEEAERQRVAEEEVRKEENRDDVEGSEDGPRKSQEGRTPSSASC